MKKGQLSTISFSQLLIWIEKGGKTGTLIVSKNGQDKHSIFFKEGKIIYVYSSKPEELIEKIIIQKRYIPETTLSLAKSNIGKDGANLLESLVKMNLLNKNQVEEINSCLMMEILGNIYTWMEGDFVFYPDQLPEKGFKPVSLSITEVIEKGEEKAREVEEVKKTLPKLNSKVFPVIKMKSDSFKDLSELDTVEMRALEIADGNVTVGQLLMEISDDLAKSGKILKALFDRGYLSVIGLEQLLEEAKKVHQSGKLYQAFEMIKEIYKDFPNNEEVKNLVFKYKEDLIKDIKKKIVSLRAIPHLTEKSDLTSWRELNLDNKTVFVLSRIDGVINIHQLISASGLGKSDLCMMIYRLLELDLIRLELPKVANDAQLEEAQYALETELSPADQEKIERVMLKYRKLKQDNHYQILEINPSADENAIKRAYFSLAKEFHPDSFKSNLFAPLKSKAEAIFSRIQEAYETLIDQQKREEYDQKLGLKEETEKSLMKKRINEKAQLQFKIGVKCFQRRDYQRAIEFIKSAIELNPENPAYYAQLAEVMKKNPKWYAEAKQYTLKAIQLLPTDPSLYNLYASIAQSEGAKDQAIEYYYKALQVDPTNEVAIAAIEAITGEPYKPKEFDYSVGKKLVPKKRKEEDKI